jgi:hypothetical protein
MVKYLWVKNSEELLTALGSEIPWERDSDYQDSERAVL